MPNRATRVAADGGAARRLRPFTQSCRGVSWRGVAWRGVAWFHPVVVGPSPLVNDAPHFLPSPWPSCPFLRSRQAREAEQLAILEEEKKAANATSAILDKNMGSRKGPDAGTR